MAKTARNSIGRFLKRNFLYILLILCLILFFALVVLGVWVFVKQRAERVPRIEPAASSAAEAPDGETTAYEVILVDPDPSEETPEELPPAADPEEDGPPPAPGWQENGQFVQPFAGTSVLMEGRQLALTYDESRLTLSEKDGVYSLTDLQGSELPRLDLQMLDTSLAELEDEDLSRLAVGILQAYYIDAPSTADVSVTEFVREERGAAVSLSAPQTASAGAARAKIRFLQTADAFWFAALLLPEGTDAPSLTQAFEAILIK